MVNEWQIMQGSVMQKTSGGPLKTPRDLSVDLLPAANVVSTMYTSFLVANLIRLTFFDFE